MKTQKAYALVYKKSGNLAVIDARPSIYWLKKVALAKAEMFSNCKVIKVTISESNNETTK